MYKILNNNIKQLNVGDVQGTLYNSFNVDLTFNEGKLCIAPRTRITTDNPTDFGTPVGFVFWDGLWWTVSGSYVWKASNPQATFAKDASNGGSYLTPSTCDSKYSDILVFNNYLIVSTTDRIYRKTANGSGTGGWELVQGSLTSTLKRPLAVFNNRLYWAPTENTINSCDTSWTVSTTSDAAYNFTFPVQYQITTIRAFASGLYIGTITTDATEGKVTDWNGETKNTFRYEYKIHAQGALSIYVNDSSVYCMNSNAELLKFTGGGFARIARLPIKRDALWNANAIGSTGNDRFIHPNGMTLIDNNISLLIKATNNDSAGSQDDNIHSGIWELIEDKGTLYHKYSMSMNTIGGSTTDYGQLILKTAGGLAETPDTINLSDAQKANFLAGAGFYSDATTVEYGVFADNYYDNEEKAGFFSTVQIRASHFEDMWNKITASYTPTTGINFVMKYRTVRVAPVDCTITWTSTTTFTTTQSGIVDGDEITITRGKGSGRVAHVVGTPTFSTPNYTVTLDEVVTGAASTATARIEKWKRVGAITSTSQFFREAAINSPSTLIEIKVALLGTGEFAIDDLILDNKVNK